MTPPPIKSYRCICCHPRSNNVKRQPPNHFTGNIATCNLFYKFYTQVIMCALPGTTDESLLGSSTYSIGC